MSSNYKYRRGAIERLAILILNSLSITSLYQKMTLREFESLLALICLKGPIIFVYISVHGLFLMFFFFVRLLHMLASDAIIHKDCKDTCLIDDYGHFFVVETGIYI
jgi:hypothetical protein